MSHTDTRVSPHSLFDRSDQQKILAAVIGSLLLHVLVVFSVAVWKMAVPAPSPVPDTPLEVTLVPAEEKPKAVQLAQLRERKPEKFALDSAGLQESEKAPEDAPFESDKNMKAASELPATGDAPLPTQQGKQRPFTQFENREYSLGKDGAPSDPRPEMKFVPQPKPVPQTVPESRAEVEQRPMESTPQPEQTPEAMPKPTPVSVSKPDATPEPDSLPMLAANPTPLPLDKPTPSQALAMLKTQPSPRTNPQPQTQPPKSSGYQPQRERTSIEGSISNRGRSSVNAVGTPLGRYRKLIADAIGSRWYFYVNQRMDLITIGSVHIKFLVDENGRVEQVRVLSNSSNETFANYSVQSILEAKMPPLPAETVPLLDNGRLEVEYTFTIYPN